LIAILRHFEILVLWSSNFEVNKIDVVIRNFLNSARNTIFVVIIVLLSSLECPPFIGAISVDLYLSIVLSMRANEEVSSENTAAMSAITAETTVFFGREIEISLA